MPDSLINTSILQYDEKLKQLKPCLNHMQEQLREQAASLWKLRDTIDDDSNDCKNDDAFTISVNGLGKINDKSYSTNVTLGCKHI